MQMQGTCERCGKEGVPVNETWFTDEKYALNACEECFQHNPCCLNYSKRHTHKRAMKDDTSPLWENLVRAYEDELGFGDPNLNSILEGK